MTSAAPPDASNAFSRIQATPNLVDQVVEAIRNEILSGTLQPGDFLPSEGKLAVQFGVSRTVVREAMHQLRFADMVEVSHGRRPCVKEPSPQASLLSLVTWMQRSELAIHQLLQVRRPLECEIACLAAKACDDALLGRLRQTIDDLRNAGTMQARIKADACFHRSLAEATGNPIFTLLMDVLAELLDEQRRRTLRGDGLERAAKDHQVIVSRIATGDPDAASQAMTDHLVWPRD
jgi:GntR family transcriptional repressor for pyruvate dehydrogenase complex